MTGELENLRHVLQVCEDRVFQAVTGIRSTTAFSGAQVLGESGIKERTWLLRDLRIIKILWSDDFRSGLFTDDDFRSELRYLTNIY